MVPCLPEEKESMEMTDCDDQFRTKQFIFILVFSEIKYHLRFRVRVARLNQIAYHIWQVLSVVWLL